MHQHIRLFLIGLSLIFSVQTFSQTNDNLIWASFKLHKDVTEKTNVHIEPHFRFNNDISSYQNMSIQAAVKQKLGKGWSAQVLARTWFVPEQTFRQFLWFDLGYGKSIDKFKIGSSLRWHHAFDIKDRVDGDFMRWKTTLSYSPFPKLRTFFAYEPWWQLNKVNEWQRVRYEPGIAYKFADQWEAVFIWRREESANLEIPINDNQFSESQ